MLTVIDLSTLVMPDGFIVQGDFDWRSRRSERLLGRRHQRRRLRRFHHRRALRRRWRAASAGEAYVIFGKASGFANIDLTTLAPADGFIIQGDAAGDQAGQSVASAGDVNGDGYDDIIIGAPYGDDGGTSAGEAYVIFGKSTGFANIDLSALAPADGFILQGSVAFDRAAESVSSAGDINGDGYDDMLVGALFGDDGGNTQGVTYVVFGKASGFATVDLSALTPADGFVISGESDLDISGDSVSPAGDVNGDGYDDILIGARGGDDGGTNSGEAYVIFGKVGRLYRHRPDRADTRRRLQHPGRCRGRHGGLQRCHGRRRQRRRP